MKSSKRPVSNFTVLVNWLNGCGVRAATQKNACNLEKSMLYCLFVRH